MYMYVICFRDVFLDHEHSSVVFFFSGSQLEYGDESQSQSDTVTIKIMKYKLDHVYSEDNIVSASLCCAPRYYYHSITLTFQLRLNLLLYGNLTLL